MTSSEIYPFTVKIILWIFQLLMEISYLGKHIIRLFQKKRKCPPVKDKLLLVSATDLAESIRKKEIKCVDVIQAYISRITEVNPIINAVIENRFQDALEDAKKVDDLVQNSKLSYQQMKDKYPLLGVPITVKGSIAAAGMLISSGRPDHLVKADVDAVIVKHAKDAGAIPLLVSNVPELCLNWETRNKLIGVTSNPYDVRRTPAGSSGGEASLLGCGASLIGVGSDIAGSLRLPAHNCGIWGHKPSPHVVSNVGHYPDCKNKDDWNQVFTLGPLARYAQDLRLLLGVIAEPEIKPILKLDQKVEFKDLKLYYIEDVESVLTDRVDGEIVQAVRMVVSHFETIWKSKCAKVKIPLMKYCAELSYLRLLNIDGVENIFEGKGEGVYHELFDFIRSKSQHEFTSICYGLLRRHSNLIPVKTMNTVYKCIDMLKNDFLKLLGDDGVCILPTSPCEANFHGDVYRKLFNGGYLAIFNSLGFPTTNCQVTFSKNDLPLGIQVVAAPNMDRLTLSVAEEIEKAFGGWKFK